MARQSAQTCILSHHDDDNCDDDCDDHDDCDNDQDDEDARARLWAQPCTLCDVSTPFPHKVCFSIKVKQFRAVIWTELEMNERESFGGVQKVAR